MPQLDEILALSLIEQGSRMMPLDRAVLLAATLGSLSYASAAKLPLDRRDRLLIDARTAAFGPYLEFFARCPHCNEGNEAEFDLSLLPQPGPLEAIRDVAGRQLVLRAPSSVSVAEAVRAGNPQVLFQAAAGVADLVDQPQLVGEIEAALADAFPLLDPRFDLQCSACGEAFSIRFDIAAWLWREVEELAARALDAVDRLARAYGWNEGEILGLSPVRRNLYLARLGG